LEKILLSTHRAIAFLVQAPEFQLDDAEASEMAKAVSDVNALYPVRWLTDEMVAWGTLAEVMFVVYGTKFAAYKLRRNLEKREVPGPRPAPRPTVVNPATPPDQMNGSAPKERPPLSAELRTGEIAGVGKIEFPADHPLMGGRKQ
jgi:hypothetical protein